MTGTSTMKAFMTGSHVYGKPTPNSDVDLVIYVDQQTAKRLFSLSDEPQSDAEGKYSTIMFGRLNLLVCTDETRFASWQKGTEQLCKQQPVTREDAIDVFKRLFASEAPQITDKKKQEKAT